MAGSGRESLLDVESFRGVTGEEVDGISGTKGGWVRMKGDAGGCPCGDWTA